MRILIAGFQHETNSFAPSLTDYESFVTGGMFPRLARGEAVLAMRDVNIPIAGFIRVAEGFGHALVPVIWAGATPAARVTEDAFERIAGEICAAAAREAVDAIYLDLHGAMMCTHLDDGEGELLARLRALVGPAIPIVASLDLHANVTRRMFENADGLVAYRTYPHEDMALTGERAAALLRRIVDSGAMSRAMRRLPFLIPINAMATAHQPARSVYAELERLEAGFASLSFAPGFPAADFAECGGTIWGYGADAEKLDQTIDALTAAATTREPEWQIDFLNPDAAVDVAITLAATTGRPVVIADTQDNPGAGGNSDTMGMLRALLAAKVARAAIGLIVDPAAAQAAHAAGVGAEITTALGGRSGAPGDLPLSATFRVEQLSDGRCRFEGPMMTGKLADVGPTARLSIDGVQIVVSSLKDQMLDRNLFRMAGVEPETMDIVVVKSSVHFRADFEPISGAVLVAKAPGPVLVDPRDLAWTRLPLEMRRGPMATVAETL